MPLPRPAAAAPGASVSDFARLGDVYQAMKRYNEAADAYGRALALAQAQGMKSDLWPLLPAARERARSSQSLARGQAGAAGRRWRSPPSSR